MRAWLNGEEIEVSDLLVKISTEPVYTEKVYFKGVELGNGDTLKIVDNLKPLSGLVQKEATYIEIGPFINYERFEEGFEE